MDDTFVETLEGLLGGDLASTNLQESINRSMHCRHDGRKRLTTYGANLDEAVDGAVEEGMAHVHGQVQSRRLEAAGEATVRHCLPLLLDAAAIYLSIYNIYIYIYMHTM